MKLLVMVVDGMDADRLADELVTAGYPVTKLGSNGGFLRRRSSTIISGVDDSAVDDAITIAERLTHARTEFAPVHQLPFLGDDTSAQMEGLEVRRGGAVIWVLPVDRFERL